MRRLPGTVAALALAACSRGGAPSAPPDAAVTSGADLARTFCTRCHQLPDPSMLPRATWPGVVTLMGFYLGHDPQHAAERLPRLPTGARFYDERLVPKTPLLDAAAWDRLRAHFLDAPGAPPPPPNPPAAPLALFEPVDVPLAVVAPNVTLVRVDPASHGLWVGEARTNTLRRYDAAAHATASVALPGPPVDLRLRPDRVEVTSIGDLPPGDEPHGGVFAVARPAPGALAAKVEPVLGGLFRAVQTEAVDLDGDGDEDLVACEFGHFAGRFAWYERLPGGFRPHVLIDRPGAVAARVGDFDRDGRPDLLVLMAQAREGLYLLHNDGGGAFTEQALLETGPANGFTDLRLADFDGDGRPEVLLVNGDNGDLPDAPLRAYHGLRIYDWAPPALPTLRAFLPLHGAFRAVTADFDGDCDVDIAATAFFPDPRTPEQGFAYFENAGPKGFARRALPLGGAGRWMTLDAGDLDGDGDVDLVLGAAYPDVPTVPPGAPPPDPRMSGWKGVVVLRNRTK